MVLYRKYRPQQFSEIVGQDAAKTLLSQLEAGKISHGYLFCGPRGTGKTSAARIFAKAVNCAAYNLPNKRAVKFGEPCNRCDSCKAISDGSHLDLVEIDAASNRNIDDIRDLREKIKLSPVSSRFKVYIVDEVHMLTKEAFNAFLKTLEEPPSHAVFILCTTEVTKLPETIISRVQRFNFSRASDDDLISAVGKVSKAEGIKIEKEAQTAIAKAADGSYRDAISILDQLSTLSKEVSVADVQKVTMASNWNQTFSFVEFVIKRDIQAAVSHIEKVSEAGSDMSFFAKEVILFLEKLLFLKIGIPVGDMEAIQIQKMKELSGGISKAQIQNLMKLFLIAEGEIKLYPLPQIPLVLSVCKYCLPEDDEELEEFEDTGISPADDKEEETAIEPPEKKIPESKVGRNEKVTDGKPSLGLLSKKWAEFLNGVRPINTHLMAILRATNPVQLKNDTLVLEVFYKFHKDRLEEPKIVSAVEAVLSEVLKRPTKMKIVLSEKKNKLPRAVRASDLVQADPELDKLSAEIVEIFSK